MTKVLSNILFVYIGIFLFHNSVFGSEYTNLKQALKNPKDVTILKLDIHGIAKKYQSKIFPLGIGKMSNLERIEINTTTFTGFPKEISNCKNLKSIVLMGNFEFPKEIALLELDSIKWNISKEKLETIPKEVYTILSLKFLSITHQNIKEISRDFNQLKHLKHLDLSDNKIELIEDNFGDIPNLEILLLQNNQIKGFPSGVKKTKNIKEINLNNNLLNSLPAFLFYFPQLSNFQYKNNPISPESLLSIAKEEAQNLHIFCSVDGEKNTNIKEIVENPSNIIMLSIHGKKNAEIFMQNADKFYSLVYLEISGDVNFTYEIENLIKVARLRKMVYNPLNGKIPAGFSKVVQIESFEANLGEFSKVMPRVLFEMTQLKELSFSAYNLETIPSNISKLTNLESLTINGNFKTIPESIDSLKLLKSINIESQFTQLNR